MYQYSYRPLRRVKRALEKSSYNIWLKIALTIIDKVVLVVLTAGTVAFFQNRLQLSEERLAKARRISEILVDKPVSIVGELPAHLDAFLLYADHIRSANLDNISSERLTELRAAIRSDIDGSCAYYSSDQGLKSLGDRIKIIVTDIRATAIDQHSLQPEDLKNLEEARNLAYNFQRRVIELSVQQEFKLFDADYKQHR